MHCTVEQRSTSTSGRINSLCPANTSCDSYFHHF